MNNDFGSDWCEIGKEEEWCLGMFKCEFYIFSVMVFLVLKYRSTSKKLVNFVNLPIAGRHYDTVFGTFLQIEAFFYSLSKKSFKSSLDCDL